jgi:hypothetical protein
MIAYLAMYTKTETPTAMVIAVVEEMGPLTAASEHPPG